MEVFYSIFKFQNYIFEQCSIYSCLLSDFMVKKESDSMKEV